MVSTHFPLFCLCAILLGMVPFGATAQTHTVQAASASLLVKIEAPAWTAEAEISRQNGVSGTGLPVSLVEFIPKGDSFDTWSQLYAVMIEEQVTLSLEQYCEQQIGRFVGACEIRREEVFVYDTPSHYALFVVPCGSYQHAPDQGEVAIFFIVQVGPHLVKIYHHMRGDDFAIRDTSSWPFSPQDMDQFLQNIRSIRISERP